MKRIKNHLFHIKGFISLCFSMKTPKQEDALYTYAHHFNPQILSVEKWAIAHIEIWTNPDEDYSSMLSPDWIPLLDKIGIQYSKDMEGRPILVSKNGNRTAKGKYLEINGLDRCAFRLLFSLLYTILDTIIQESGIENRIGKFDRIEHIIKYTDDYIAHTQNWNRAKELQYDEFERKYLSHVK